MIENTLEFPKAKELKTQHHEYTECTSKLERHKHLCLALNDIYIKKNADYGDSFHATYTEEGMAVPRIRLTDKLSRFKNLTQQHNTDIKVQDESVRDTLLDLANYALMTVLELDCEKEEES